MPPKVRRPRWEPLEPRVLYSADPAPLALAGQLFVATAQPATEIAPARAAPAAELVVVDARVTGRDALVADLQAQQAAGRPMRLVLLDAQDDAVARIGDALAASDAPVSAIHLIGHGEPGAMMLGNGRLDLDTVRARAGELAAWSPRLATGADLLLYGCDVAAGSEGDRLLDALASLTGADVAASVDATGAVSAGGNWILERRTGPIDTALAPDAAMRDAWTGLLGDSPTVSSPVKVPVGNPTTAFLSSVPQVHDDQGTGRQLATAADGRRALAWVQDGNIQIGIWDPAGKLLASQTVAPVNGTRLDGTATAFDGAGNLLVTWVVHSDSPPAGSLQAWIEGRVLAPDGTARATVSLASLRPTELPGDLRIETVSLERPEVAGRTGEGFRLVTDVQSSSDVRRGGIYIANVGIDGTVSGFAAVQSDWTAGSTLRLGRPTITTLAGDGYAIGWDAVRYKPDRTTYLQTTDYVSLRTASGERVGSDVAIWSGTTSGVFCSPDLGGDPYGGVWAVWGVDGKILARHLDAGGATLGSPALTVASTDAGVRDVALPAVAVADDGSLWVAWVASLSGGKTAIVLENLDASGRQIGNAVQVESGSLDRDGPAIALDGRSLQIAWSTQIAAGRYELNDAWVYPNWTVMTASATPGGRAPTGMVQAVKPAPVSLTGDLAMTIDENTQGARFTVIGLSANGGPAPTWQVSGADASDFTWKAGTDAQGRSTLTLTLRPTPDFEALAAQGRSGYRVDIRQVQGNGQSATGSLIVTVRDVNEPFTLSAGAALATDEDVSVALGASAPLLADPDAGQVLSVTLNAGAGGSLQLDRTDGLSAVQGNGGGTLLLTGGVSALNAALGALVWRPAPDWNGATTLTVDVVDPGSATIPPLRATVSLTARTVNEPPVVLRNTGVTGSAGSLVTLDGQVLSVTDVDAPDPSKLVYTVDDLPPSGELRRYPSSGNPKNFRTLAAGDTFLQADLDAGRIVYVARDATPAGAALSLTVSDGQGGVTAVRVEVSIAPAPASAAMMMAAGSLTATGAGLSALQPASLTVSGTAASPASAAPTSVSQGSASTTQTAPTTSAVTGTTTSTPAASGASQSASTAPASPTVSTASANAATATRGTNAKTADGTADEAPPVVTDAGPGGIRAAADARGPAHGGQGPETESRAGDATLSSTGRQDRDGSDRRGGWASADPARRSGPGTSLDRDARRGSSADARAWIGSNDDASHPIAQALSALPASEGVSQVREAARERVEIERTVVATSAAVTTGLSIGYAIWLLRGGVLLSSLLASVPAWRSFDPMMLLAKPAAGGGGDGNDDSLQSLLDRAAERDRGGRPAVDAPDEGGGS